MARSTKMSESPAPFRDDLYEASPPPSHQRRSNATHQSMSPSPAASVSSDKENRTSRAPVDKGKGRAPMGPPSAPTFNEQGGSRKRAAESDHNNERTRRRRTVEVNEDESDHENERTRRIRTAEANEEELNHTNERMRRRRTVEVNEDESEVDYDPDQDIEVRRRLRKGLRDLSKNLLENRSEFLNPNSTGLRDTLLKANDLSGQVKQTSDATIDSRLLTTVADYSYKKTVALISGDTAQGVDVDEFISKCLSFMRQGAGEDRAAPSNTQRRRRRNNESDDEEDDNDGEVVDWAYLGRHASVRNNSRPSVSGFLLGPLSLQKRVRAQVVRKAAFRPNNLRETRPEVIQADDITTSEAGLTTLCAQIADRLDKVRNAAMAAIDTQTRDDMSAKEGDELLDRYGMSRNGGIAFFKFVINPHSFGQTIENMFYVSFLIRDGKVGISMDDRGLPYLNFPEESTGNRSGKGRDTAKHQAVLAIDMDHWEQLIDLFDIKEPMIQHREEEEQYNVGRRGWYA
ncbi:Nse4 domain containing protein [Hyaloscypha variabilis]|uniref:Non-structural maintenance of chromosomes element 4 n=1 Tax=Hyaloscypha variabilis (strain UAMH 11265 / GT02V1 / F) TaxID=1149755 RepID=A0A2J6R2W3_HYAVF|nr:Nse4-domain-containing protein [Hyaloscypha variabilis F]